MYPPPPREDKSCMWWVRIWTEKARKCRQTKVLLLIPPQDLNETDRHLPAPIYKMDGALSTIVT